MLRTVLEPFVILWMGLVLVLVPLAWPFAQIFNVLEIFRGWFGMIANFFG